MSLIKLSKKMAYTLRHSPESFNLFLDAMGRTTLEELSNALGISVDTIHKIVENDNKSRFVIKDNLIWAAQGHSFPVNILMNKILKPGVLFHGTLKESFESIKSDGAILRGSRNFVHLSKDINTAINVAERRQGEHVVITIDGDALVESGHDVFISSNNVCLTESVPIEFFIDMKSV